MPSDEAHAWLFVDLINTHLREHVDPDDSPYYPDHCGPCNALRNYWNTFRGRNEAQMYLNKLAPVNRVWGWAPNGVINWAEIERRMHGGQESTPMVTVRKKVYDEMVEDQKVMIALQNCGVDSWDGYEAAMQYYEKEML